MRKAVIIILILSVSLLYVGQYGGTNNNQTSMLAGQDNGSRPVVDNVVMGKSVQKSTYPWIDSRFKYRKEINVTERAGRDINYFPVEFFVRFDPPAYFDSQASHSIRVFDYSGNEVPIQIYNITWYDYANRLISAATIAMYVSLSAGSTSTYHIYWTDEPTSSVSYDPVVNFVQTSTGYIFSTSMYEVETKDDFGGKIYRISLGGIDIIHSSQDEYMDKSAHFSPIYNPTYSDATIGSTQVLALNGHYQAGISDNANHGEPELSIAGPVFLEYNVTDIAIIQSGYTIAYADITYRFYKDFFIVRERIRFPSSAGGEFWIGGWHVDQDDESSNGQFDRIYMDAASTNGYTYPYNLSYIESTDDADAAQLGNMWTRFYVFNTTKYFGLGYVYLGHSSSGVTINSYDSYWINEGSSNDWTYFFSDSGSLDSDGGDSFYFYIMAGRKVEVVFDFHINDPYGWLDDANIYVAIYDPSGNVVPGQEYYSGEPAPEDGRVIFDFDASSTGWYHLAFDYDSADDLGWNDDRMSWSSYMVYLTSDYSYIFDDYFVWGNRLDLDASAGANLELDYAMIPWYSYGESWYDLLADVIENPPEVSISGVVEQYYSEVTIYVKDKDRKPIADAYVCLNGTSGAGFYEGYTNDQGYIRFIVVRDTYDCVVNVTSNGLKYLNSTYLYISTDYSLDKAVSHVFIMDIVKLSIRFVAADNVTTIQGAKIVLSNASYGTINITSDLEGAATIYLRPAVWRVYHLEYAYVGSYYDNFSIKDAITGDYIIDTSGAPVKNVSEALIRIDNGQSWVLIDHMAKDVKPTSKFEIYNGSPAQTVVWGETLEWLIKWVDQYGKYVDLREGNESEGDYFMWELRFADNDSPVYIGGRRIYQYYVPSNVSMCLSYTSYGPVYAIRINTSILRADITYYVVVDGIINFLQKPQQIYLFLSVDSVPTVCSLDAPSEVYWNETLDIKLRIWDSEGNPLSGADTELEILDYYQAVIYSSEIPEVGEGVYEVSIICDFQPGKYTIRVSYYKQNYATGYVPTRDVSILVRPTSFQLVRVDPAPIEFSLGYNKMYWGNYIVMYAFKYSDDVSLSTIRNVSAIANIYKITPNGSVLLSSLEAIYNTSTDEYRFYINISDLSIGTYSLVIEFSKTNYESQRSEITLAIVERPTTIKRLVSDYVIGYYGKLTTVRFYLEDSLTEEPVPLSSSDISVRVRDISSGVAVDVSVVLYNNGTCVIYYPTTLPPSKYNTTIHIRKPNYEAGFDKFIVEIKERPTYVDASSKFMEVIWGDYAEFHFWYIDTLAGQLIDDATTSAQIFDSRGREIFRTALIAVYLHGSRMYILKFNTNILRSGETYDILVTFSKTNYEALELTVKLHVDPIKVEAEYDDSIRVLKNPITNEAKARITIRLYDASPGHEKKEYKAEKATYVLLSHTGERISEGKLGYSNGSYYLEMDLSGVPVGTYLLEVSFDMCNATLANETNRLIIKISLDYWGGTIEIMGRRYPTVLVVPSLVLMFLSTGVATYYVWVRIHIPWEVKYINWLLKQLRKGVTEFETIDRDTEIGEIAKELLT